MTTKNSSIMTNTLAEPKGFNNVRRQGGVTRVVLDTFEVAVGDLDTADIINLVRLPGNALIKSIKIANDDLDTATGIVFDLGIQDVDGAVKDVNAFASAVTQFQGAAGFTELANEARVIEDLVTPLFELAGDTELVHDAQYDIVITLSAGATTPVAGTISVDIEYVDD